MPIPFTQNSLHKLLGTTGKREVIHDPQNKGLRCELREGGSMAFYIFARVPGGRVVRYRIGAFPQVTVDEARKQAQHVFSELATGNDVAAVRREERAELTFGELFNTVWIPHAKQHKKTWDEDERQYKQHLTGWQNRQLSTITRTEVKALHVRIGESSGVYSANRLLALIRAVLNHAIKEELFTNANPAAGIPKFKEQSRDRFLQPDELPRFLAAVNEEPNPTIRDFFLMLLFTGARKENVASMRWCDISYELETWRIPETKQGKVHFAPLSKPALEILHARQLLKLNSQFVFPANSKSGHLMDPMKPWNRVLERAGITNRLRLHDLRRTFGSYQALSGASLAIIGKTLGHSRQETTAVYARLTDGAVKQSVDTAVASMLATVKKEGGK
jgi:integrase